MTVELSPRGQRLLEAILAQETDRTPEEVIEAALEMIAPVRFRLSEEERERTRKGLEGLRAFAKEHHLNIKPEEILEMIREGRK